MFLNKNIQIFLFLIPLFLQVSVVFCDDSINSEKKEYSLKINNEPLNFYFLSDNSINQLLETKDWVLERRMVKEGQFEYIYEKDNTYLMIFNSGNKAILTGNQQLYTIIKERDIIFFSTIDITNVLFYYVMEKIKLAEFMDSNDLKKIEITIEGINPDYTEYFELHDGRVLKVDTGSNTGFLFMSRAALDSWNDMIYPVRFDVIVIPTK